MECAVSVQRGVPACGRKPTRLVTMCWPRPDRFTRGPGHRHRSNATTTTLARPGLDNIELNKAENVTFVCIAGDTGFGLFRLLVGGSGGHLLTGIVDPARTEMGFLFLCPGCCNWSVSSSSPLFGGIAKPFVVVEVDGVFISSLKQQSNVFREFCSDGGWLSADK